MKTDSERQIEYQQRRRETQERITFWMNKDVAAGIDTLRQNESRTMWINRAITELAMRQLLGKKFPYSADEHEQAQIAARELGFNLPT